MAASTSRCWSVLVLLLVCKTSVTTGEDTTIMGFYRDDRCQDEVAVGKTKDCVKVDHNGKDKFYEVLEGLKVAERTDDTCKAGDIEGVLALEFGSTGSSCKAVGDGTYATSLCDGQSCWKPIKLDVESAPWSSVVPKGNQDQCLFLMPDDIWNNFPNPNRNQMWVSLNLEPLRADRCQKRAGPAWFWIGGKACDGECKACTLNGASDDQLDVSKLDANTQCGGDSKCTCRTMVSLYEDGCKGAKHYHHTRPQCGGMVTDICQTSEIKVGVTVQRTDPGWQKNWSPRFCCFNLHLHVAEWDSPKPHPPTPCCP